MTSSKEIVEIINQSNALIEKSRTLCLEAKHTSAVTAEINTHIREDIRRMHQEIKNIDTAIIGFKGGNTLFNGKK